MTRARASRAAAHAPVDGVRLPNGGWHLRIGMKLQSPNRKSGHPMVQHRERVDWTVAVENALIKAVNPRRLTDMPQAAPRVPVRLTLTREVPSEKHFITDLDNLWFAAKRLTDSLKHNHLLYDDSMTWCERPRPLQRVSHDGLFWTDIVIEPIGGSHG